MKKLLITLALGVALCGCRSLFFVHSHSFIPFNDGDNALANDLFLGADKALINALAPDGHTPVSCNVFCIWKGDKQILIDTGYGGALQDDLKKRNIHHGDITDILITHVHFDHVGGLLTTNGTAAFPNATVHITAAELDFWRNAEPPLADPKLAAAVEKMYKISLITPDGETPVAIPGLVAIDAAGHTPGHVIFLYLGRFLYAGDLLHSELFQFAHPGIYPVFDNDKDAALAVRRKILSLPVDRQWFYHSCHVKESGLLVKDGDGFTWAP